MKDTTSLRRILRDAAGPKQNKLDHDAKRLILDETDQAQALILIKRMYEWTSTLRG